LTLFPISLPTLPVDLAAAVRERHRALQDNPPVKMTGVHSL
jgi:hypothetical protein